MNDTNDNKKEKFYIGGFGFVSIEEAKLLLQRIVPLARIYQNTYKIKKCFMPREAEEARMHMDGLLEKQAESIVVQLLASEETTPTMSTRIVKTMVDGHAYGLVFCFHSFAFHRSAPCCFSMSNHL